MAYLILLRHGESEFNQESKFCGWINASLTKKGELQALNIAELLSKDPLTENIPIGILVTSRLKRAVLTAEKILEGIDRLDMDIIKTWRLNERHYGALQGMKKNDILTQYGHDLYMYWRRGYEGKPPDSDVSDDSYKDTLKMAEFDDELSKHEEMVPLSESLKDVINRLAPFWENVMMKKLKEGKNVLCVTHGSVVRALLTIIYQLGREEVEHLNIPNGMPILIEFDEGDSMTLVTDKWVYLEPEKAKLEAERVKRDGYVGV